MTRIEELKARMRQQFITGATGQDVFSDLVSAYESELVRKDAALREIIEWVDQLTGTYFPSDLYNTARSALTPARETGETK